MKNKMLLIIGTIVVLFVALVFVVNYKNKQAVDSHDNPYGKENLHQATIDQLDDPNYGNQILPDELAEKLENGEDITVYYYDPTCPHCLEMTPVLVPLAKDMGVDVKKFNLLEFDNDSIKSTPTLVHYEDGEEVARLEGSKPEEEIRDFFNQYVLEDET
ncbi:MAG TPA: thioredoxin family protein [Bacillota bacterium]|nr:thioredoxin family protein [Bacillota bacterium]